MSAALLLLYAALATAGPAQDDAATARAGEPATAPANEGAELTAREEARALAVSVATTLDGLHRRIDLLTRAAADEAPPVRAEVDAALGDLRADARRIARLAALLESADEAEQAAIKQRVIDAFQDADATYTRASLALLPADVTAPVGVNGRGALETGAAADGPDAAEEGEARARAAERTAPANVWLEGLQERLLQLEEMVAELEVEAVAAPAASGEPVLARVWALRARIATVAESAARVGADARVAPDARALLDEAADVIADQIVEAAADAGALRTGAAREGDGG